MSEILAQKKPKDPLSDRIANAAAGVAAALAGFDKLLEVSYVTIASASRQAKISNLPRPEPGLSKSLAHENEEKQRSESQARLDVVERASKGNPITLKPLLEKMALASLREACELHANGRTNDSSIRFLAFTNALVDARKAGPISAKTLAAIRDIAYAHRETCSLMHMAMDHAGHAKHDVVKVLLEAKINPDFRVDPKEPSIMAAATRGQDERMMKLLADHGADTNIKIAQTGLSPDATRGRTSMNAWDVKHLLATLQASPKGPSLGRLRPA